MWALIWCLATIAAYVAVIIGMRRNDKKFLIPAMGISMFNVVIGCVNGIIAIFMLNWFT